MFDTKIENTGVARRSARTFESDIDFNNVEGFAADTGSSYNMQRKRGDMSSEHSQERASMAERRRSTRSSSMSSTTAVDDDDITSILGGLDKMAHEKDGKGTSSARLSGVHTRTNLSSDVKESQIEVVKAAKPKTPGRPRNFGTVAPGIYRSGYPETEDHDFLKDLGLRTIV